MLRQRSPNPAHDQTQLEFLVPVGAEGALYELAIYDLAGRRIRTLARGVANRGGIAASWSLRDDGGRPVPGGVYFARLLVGSQIITTKIAVLH